MPTQDTEYSFKKLMIVYILWNVSASLVGSLFEVYFFNLGLSLPNIYLADTLWFIGSLLVIPLFRGFRARNFMLIGIIIAIIASSTLYLSPQPEMAFIFRMIIGFSNLFFWAPFNTLYYEYSKKNNAVLGAIYYAVNPILSLFTPAFAGFLATSIGFPSLYLLSMVSFALTLIAAFFFIENRSYGYTLSSCIKSLSGLRSLIFMEGFAAGVIISVSLEVMLVIFAKKPSDFGLFTSLATVFAVVASFVTAKISDKAERRREFLLPIVVLFSLSVIIASQSHDIWMFFIGFALVSFFSRIFFPLPLALVVDNSKSLAESMVGRELYLNIGRLCGGVLGYLILLHSDIGTVVLFQGVSLLVYIPIFENRKKKLLRH